jgi:hypothetical protein
MCLWAHRGSILLDITNILLRFQNYLQNHRLFIQPTSVSECYEAKIFIRSFTFGA